jgi:hypothetical protein
LSGPPLKGFFDRLYHRDLGGFRGFKKFVRKFGQWFLEIFRCAGQGYLNDCQAAPGDLVLRSGHAFALSLSLMAFVTYLVIGYWKSKIDERPHIVPALAFLLLLGIVLCWALGAFAFFLDRYRVPLLSGLAILSLLTISAPQSDHVYRIQRIPARGKLIRIEPAALVQKRAEAGKKRIILVATAGGGIQAAAWTTRVLRGLEQECAKTSPPANAPLCDFRDSVILISGVSGGSLGAMAYARSFSDFPSHVDPSEVPVNAAQPALDEVAWAWMNPDVRRNILPWFSRQYIDRGWALEEKWSAMNKTYVSRATTAERLLLTDYGADTWLGDWAREAQWHTMPALLLNSTLAEMGRPLVFSSTNFPRPGDPRGLQDFYGLYPGFDIRITTAARLSASFPFVAPAARASAKPATAGDYHVVDGGYYDNYGITSLLGWLEDAILHLPADEIGKDLGDVLILQIRPFANGAPTPPQPVGWGFQVDAPLTTLLNTRDIGQSARDQTELALFTKGYGQEIHVWQADFVYPESFKKRHSNCADVPLSWKLSFEQTECITTAWHEVHKQDDGLPGQGAIGCVVRYLQNKPVADRRTFDTSKPDADTAFCTAGDDESGVSQ